MATRDIQNFYELRVAVDGMREAADAVTRFMDKNGLAIPSRTKRKANGSVNGTSVEAFRETAKAHFVRQRNGHKRSSWTPERRAAQAERMRQRMAEAKHTRTTKTTRTGKRANSASGKGWARRWYDRLEQHGAERVGESAQALGTSSSSLLSCSGQFLKDGVIKKGKDKGVYMVGSKPPATS